MSSGKIVTGIMIGAAAGAILGVLFAPDKGSTTRKKIAKKSSDLKDSVKDKVNDLVDSIAAHFETAADSAEDLIEKGKQRTAAMKADAKHSMS